MQLKSAMEEMYACAKICKDIIWNKIIGLAKRDRR